MRSLLSAALVVIAGATALAIATEGFRIFTAEGARRLGVIRQPQPIPDVELEDAYGQRIFLSEFRGKPLVVEFFYTGCHTLCAVMAGSFGEIQRRIRESGDTDIHLLSISFAPEDGPARLAFYAQRVRADVNSWTIARPVRSDDLDRLLHAFGTVVIPGEQGQFDHNAALHVIDRDGRLNFIGDFDDPASIARHLGLS